MGFHNDSAFKMKRCISLGTQVNEWKVNGSDADAESVNSIAYGDDYYAFV